MKSGTHKGLATRTLRGCQSRFWSIQCELWPGHSADHEARAYNIMTGAVERVHWTTAEELEARRDEQRIADERAQELSIKPGRINARFTLLPWQRDFLFMDFDTLRSGFGSGRWSSYEPQFGASGRTRSTTLFRQSDAMHMAMNYPCYTARRPRNGVHKRVHAKQMDSPFDVQYANHTAGPYKAGYWIVYHPEQDLNRACAVYATSDVVFRELYNVDSSVGTPVEPFTIIVDDGGKGLTILPNRPVTAALPKTAGTKGNPLVFCEKYGEQYSKGEEWRKFKSKLDDKSVCWGYQPEGYFRVMDRGLRVWEPGDWVVYNPTSIGPTKVFGLTSTYMNRGWERDDKRPPLWRALPKPRPERPKLSVSEFTAKVYHAGQDAMLAESLKYEIEDHNAPLLKGFEVRPYFYTSQPMHRASLEKADAAH